MNPEVRKIADLYREKLDIPKKKPKVQFYVAVVGLIGSGKTPVLKELSKKLDLVRISGDDIRRIILKNNSPLEITGEVATLLANEFSAEGYSIAHDTDGASSNTQRVIRQLEEKYGAKTFWIHVNPPEEFILNKIRGHKHAWDSVSATEKYYERKPLHRHLPMDFICEIDTSQSNLSEQIQNAADAISKGL